MFCLFETWLVRISPEYSGYKRPREKFTLLSNLQHMEKRRGSRTEAADYCKKDDKWKEFGERKEDDKPGERTDISLG